MAGGVRRPAAAGAHTPRGKPSDLRTRVAKWDEAKLASASGGCGELFPAYAGKSSGDRTKRCCHAGRPGGGECTPGQGRWAAAGAIERNPQTAGRPGPA